MEYIRVGFYLAISKKKRNYDHVGVGLYENDISMLHERIGKARQTLNDISGPGIRRNGLNIFIC